MSNIDIAKDAEHKTTLIKLADVTKISESVKANLFEEAEGVIVLLDALGTKGIWNRKRKDPMKVLKTWSALKDEFTKAIESLNNQLQTHGYFEKPKFEVFSDTIMVS